MYSEIQKLLQTRAELLCSGRFEELAAHYHLPFVAFHDGDISIIRTVSQAIEKLSDISARMALRDVVKLDVEVTSVELPRNDRFRVWCRYSEVNSAGNVISQSDVTQYILDAPSGPIVEMVESQACPLAVWEKKGSAA